MNHNGHGAVGRSVGSLVIGYSRNICILRNEYSVQLAQAHLRILWFQGVLLVLNAHN